MVIYICSKCGCGVSTSENHICLYKKPTSDVPEHVKNYNKNQRDYKTTGDSKYRAWF